MTAACVVLATHFVSMTGYVYALGQEISVGWTLLSLVIAIGCYAVATLETLSADRRSSRKFRAALMLTSAVGAMHYTGIQAYRTSADIQIDPVYVLMSFIICFAVNLGAVLFFSNKASQVRGIGTSACFFLGVISLHFTGMAGLTLVPFNGAVVGAATPLWLTPVLVVTATVIVAGGAIAVLMDRRQMRRHVDEARRLHDVLQQAPFPTTMESRDVSWRRHNLAMARFLGVTDAQDDTPSANRPLEDFIEDDASGFR